jgi:uncharacterized damage-inducible protein DinB
MKQAQYIAEYPSRIDHLVGRLTSACERMSDEQFNAKRDGSDWSPAQIIDHMMIANRGYLPVIEAAIKNAKRGDGELNHSWFGKTLIKLAGPAGNAKAPKWLTPGGGPFTRDILQECIDQHRGIAELSRMCEGVDLSKTTFRNPYVRLFKMNLADAFEAIAQHAERHIGQIEELVPNAS